MGNKCNFIHKTKQCVTYPKKAQKQNHILWDSQCVKLGKVAFKKRNIHFMYKNIKGCLFKMKEKYHNNLKKLIKLIY